MNTFSRIVAAVGVTSVVFAAPAAAQAKGKQQPVVVKGPKTTVVQGQKATLSVYAPFNEYCEISMDRKEVFTADMTESSYVQVRFKVASKAATGKHSVEVLCDESEDTVKATVVVAASSKKFKAKKSSKKAFENVKTYVADTESSDDPSYQDDEDGSEPVQATIVSKLPALEWFVAQTYDPAAEDDADACDMTDDSFESCLGDSADDSDDTGSDNDSSSSDDVYDEEL